MILLMVKQEAIPLIGWGGDDTFNITNKSGSWTDTINGGSGTDVLNISYSINLEAFSFNIIR